MMDAQKSSSHYSKRAAIGNANITYCRTVYASTTHRIGDRL
jgi:hypothetical protein